MASILDSNAVSPIAAHIFTITVISFSRFSKQRDTMPASSPYDMSYSVCPSSLPPRPRDIFWYTSRHCELSTRTMSTVTSVSRPTCVSATFSTAVLKLLNTMGTRTQLCCGPCLTQNMLSTCNRGVPYTCASRLKLAGYSQHSRRDAKVLQYGS